MAIPTSGSDRSLIGTMGDDTIDGLGGNDWIQTLDGDDMLIGGTGSDALWSSYGADIMIGGTGAMTGDETGNDTYHVDNFGDIIIEYPDQGTDRVHAYTFFDMGLRAANVENIRIVGFGIGVDAIGNDLNNTMEGNREKNTLAGGLGDDTYIVYNVADAVKDVVIENAGEGSDTYMVNFTFALGSSALSIENITLTGTKLINATGNEVDNTLTGNDAKNTLTGGDGNDTYVIQSATDVIKENTNQGNDTVEIKDLSYSIATQLNLENITLKGNAAANAIGNASVNKLMGNNGANTLDGQLGADTLTGLKGNDVYVVDNLSDVVDEGGTDGGGTDQVRASVSYALAGDLENLTLTGTSNINGTGNAAVNTLTGNAGINTLTGGLGNDMYYVQNSGDVVIELAGEGTETVFSTASFNLETNGAEIETLTLQGTLGIGGTGNALGNTINGNSGVNLIYGRGGNDTIFGNGGNDVIHGEDGIDTLYGDAGTDTITGGDGADTIDGGDANDILNGGDGADSLIGGTGIDTFIGGLGDDTYFIDGLTEKITELNGEGTDLIDSKVSYTLSPISATLAIENLKLTGTAIFGIGNEIDNGIEGNGGSNTLMGMAGNDFLLDVEGGNDTLDGGTGTDTMQGGGGNDVYIVDNALDIVSEDASSGTDSIRSSVTYDMTASATGEIEFLYLTGSGIINGTGNAFKNTLAGNSAVNTLAGGLEDDAYIMDNNTDVIREMAGEGTLDTILASVNYIMAAEAPDYEVEALTLTGTLDINGTGNGGSNTLSGNSGINILAGGLGDDWYVVDDLDDINKDTFVELVGGGNDGVLASISFTLNTATPTYQIENVTLKGAASINASGNALDNTLIGNNGNNTLNGSSGNDYLAGGGGNDTYIIEVATDVVTELAGQGNDTVNANFAYSLTTDVAEVENLTLYGGLAINGEGNAVANIIIGNIAVNTLSGLAGNDTLDGGVGADLLIGGDGNDTYYVDNSLDVITEILGEGTADTVRNSVTYDMSLQASGDVEIMIMEGLANINGIGNDLGNTMTGNAGNNTINGGNGTDTLLGLGGDDYLLGGAANDTMDGGIGIDTMSGGLGDDVYIIDAATKTVIEALGEGIDEVRSSLTHTLSANVENLTLTGGGPINGFGNALVNIIKGASGANTLDGGAGDDTLIGGGGSDIFIVDSALDIVTEAGGGGLADTVMSSVTYDMSVSAAGEVENLTLTGSANINGTGNDEHNTITGNAGINTMNGGLGSDFYVVQTVSDVVADVVGEGEDTVLSAISWALDNINETENIFLQGTAAINATGNDLGNSLIGNLGKNILNGGLGDDTYGLGTSATNDTIVLDTGGNDTVIVGATYSIATRADLENIWLTGTGLFNATGNANINTLIGNDGKNTLNGGIGADYMVGGKGDDTFYVDDVNDITLDALDRPDVDPVVLQDPDIIAGGKDTVISSVSYALSLDLDNLTLTNVATALDGMGNGLANIIKGNSFNNVLNGGAGADTMDGGAGNDTYYIDTAGDVIKDVSGIDKVFSSLAFYTMQVGIENAELEGTGPLNLTGNSGNNTLTGNSGNNILDGGAGSDVMIGGGSDNEVGDTYIVDRITDVVIGGAGLDTIKSSVTFSLVAAPDVENLTLTGTAGIHGTGNSLDNTILGNSGANTLIGGDGNDYINGGAGRDILYGGAGEDKFVFNSTADFNAVDMIMDFEFGLDTIVYGADVDPLLQVNEDFIEFRAGTGGNLNIYLDFDGPGEAFSPQLIAIIVA
jgi:Ca2+-binding RTX toxin-like protein